MKFQKKIFLVYALFGIISAVATGSIYYSMSKSHFIQQECMSLSSTAKQINQQYVENAPVDGRCQPLSFK